MSRHILIPIDEDAGSRRSIKQGVTLAQAAGARVTGFPTITEFNHAGIVDELLEPPPEELQLLAYAHAGQLFATLVDEAERAGVACTTLAGPSETPWEAIVAAATSTHSDPVVMATHGRRGIGRLVPGRQTQQVLTHADMPAPAVRGSGQE